MNREKSKRDSLALYLLQRYFKLYDWQVSVPQKKGSGKQDEGCELTQLSTSMPRPQHQHHVFVTAPNEEADWLWLLG